MDRRQFIAASTAALAISQISLSESRLSFFIAALRNSSTRVIPLDPVDTGVNDLRLSRKWNGDFCSARLVNGGKQPVRVKEVVLFSIKYELPAKTQLYGEGFQMLSQTAGTLEKPIDLGYSEPEHYRIPQPNDATVLSGLMTLSDSSGQNTVLAFTSCHKFIGRFFVRKHSIDVVVDAEGLELAPGESWQLEEFMYAEGANRPALLERVADRIEIHHPRKLFRPIPTGWCSWYCFGPDVTAKDVLANLDVIAKQIPELKFVQIDDGYQPAMGDWLETGIAFGGGVASVLKQIRQRGFEPAVWVAPFIAEANSHVFQQHPDWFIKGKDGAPLSSNEVTFGGWRRGPWYALDGTHPEVQKHLEQLFRTLHEDWGCTYFKLDATFWGAMHGGRFSDPKATRIEAYRRGMEAILRGAGDAFILGCNHPIWPSFGLIDGSRSSGDISRSWHIFSREARATLNRNWQNGRLWWNDPDAVLLAGNLSDNEFRFHATAIYASGGMILSGDDLTKISPERMVMLRRLVPPTGIAASFEDSSLKVGFAKHSDALMVCVFNWEDSPQTVSVRLPNVALVTDYWSREDLGRQTTLIFSDMPAHSARLLRCV